MKRVVSLALAVLAICACLALAACGSDDAKSIQGEWQVTESNGAAVPDSVTVTAVVTDTQFKFTTDDVRDYKLDADKKTITLTSGSASSTFDYTLSSDGKELTLTAGDNVTKYEKLSDDTSASPQYSDSSADSANSTGASK